MFDMIRDSQVMIRTSHRPTIEHREEWPYFERPAPRISPVVAIAERVAKEFEYRQLAIDQRVSRAILYADLDVAYMKLGMPSMMVK